MDLKLLTTISMIGMVFLFIFERRSVPLGVLLLSLFMPFLGHTKDEAQCSRFYGQVKSYNLVQKDNPSLRRKSTDVPIAEIGSEANQRLISDLVKVMVKSESAGIAAPQLGVNKNIIVIGNKNFINGQNLVMINPRIVYFGKDLSWKLESCYSTPGACGLVKRFKQIGVEFIDVNGQFHSIEADGYFARIVQREVDHLNGILFTDRSLFSETKARPVPIFDYDGENEGYSKLLSNIDAAVIQSINPYSLVYDVRLESESEEKFRDRIFELVSSISNKLSSSERAHIWDKWIQSQASALFVYDILSRSGLEYFSEELKYLIENNRFYSGTQRSGGGLITYSFEKEGNSADISLLYRNPLIGEEFWLELPESERLSYLKAIGVPTKEFTSYVEVAPTGLKPIYIGGYSEEGASASDKSYGWEIAHKKYEIDRLRLMSEIRDLSKIFKQTHSFHVHIVFELPKKDPQFENFVYWFKHLNDYLYLKGLEEGLHGNYLTGVANLSRDLPLGDQLKRTFSMLYTTSSMIPNKQYELGRFNGKFFSAGMRAKMYGRASSPERMKVGIELRDTTRKLDNLDVSVKKISESLNKEPWRHSDIERIKNKNLRLTTGYKTASKKLSAVVSKKYANFFARLEPTIYFGLIHFEEAPIYDYRTQTWVELPEDTKVRVRNARVTYENDLKLLEIELEKYERQGNKTEPELIIAALRMSLATWAKVAKVSSLFEGI